MKLFITATNHDGPEGFEKAHVVHGECTINLPDASCTEIIVSEGIDYVARENLQSFLEKCVSKLRQKAIITIVGVDLRGLARCVHVRDMDSNTFNSIVCNLKSFNSSSEIVDILRKLGLSLISQTITNGMYYEIKAARQ
jgi:hypothetical protein